MCNQHNDGSYGVVLAVYCRSTNRFLMLRELRGKPQFFKLEGMLAFPSETKEEDDSCVCATARRLVHEEIGAPLRTDIMLLPEPLTHFRHGLPVYIAWTVVQEEFVPQPNDTDIEYCGWFRASIIRGMHKVADVLRIETSDVLEKVCIAIERAPSYV